MVTYRWWLAVVGVPTMLVLDTVLTAVVVGGSYLLVMVVNGCRG